MSNCPKCGNMISPDAIFCPECGTNVPQENNSTQYQQPQYQSQYQTPPVMGGTQQPYQPMFAQNTITENMLPNEYKPVSIGAYIGYSLLFTFPIIGFIMMFVIGFGSTYSKSLRNFAKANLVLRAIGIVFAIIYIILIAFLISSTSLLDEFMYYY